MDPDVRQVLDLLRDFFDVFRTTAAIQDGDFITQVVALQERAEAMLAGE